MPTDKHYGSGKTLGSGRMMGATHPDTHADMPVGSERHPGGDFKSYKGEIGTRHGGLVEVHGAAPGQAPKSGGGQSKPQGKTGTRT